VLAYRELTYVFLVWNLFLAGLPLVFAFCLKFLVDHEKGSLFPQLFVFSLWLLFVPNAPYIITDLIHLTSKKAAPIWYDGAIVFSAALTGLLMGLLSLYLIHQLIKQHLNPVTSWMMISSLIALTSFGVYLGRVLRWNSWDLFTRPFSLFISIYESLFKFSAISMTLVFSSMLLLIYLTVHSLLEQKQ
jgi:uncharacterized membrane protein